MFGCRDKRSSGKFDVPTAHSRTREDERCGSLALKIHVAEKLLRAGARVVLLVVARDGGVVYISFESASSTQCVEPHTAWEAVSAR